MLLFLPLRKMIFFLVLSINLPKLGLSLKRKLEITLFAFYRVEQKYKLGKYLFSPASTHSNTLGDEPK